MKARTYVLLLLACWAITVLAILYIPGLPEGIETWLLRFLARNAAIPV